MSSDSKYAMATEIEMEMEWMGRREFGEAEKFGWFGR